MGTGRGGGYRHPGDALPSSSKIDEIEKKIEEIKKEAEEKSDLKNLQNQEENIREFVKTEMDKFSENLPWDHNDHSINHVERVLKKFPEVVQNFEDISFSKEFLNGNKLSDLDKEILKFAIILHDLGYCKSIKEHSIESEKYIKKIDRDMNQEIINQIALIAKLHTPAGIKALGGNSLSDLVKKGLITDRIAYLSSILTITDALDAGKQRVMYNSQKESAKTVIEKIKKTYSMVKAESKLEHWYGHQGFLNPQLIKEANNLALNIELNTDLADTYSSIIAFRVFDIITDITTSYLPSSKKFNLDLNIASKNPEKARNWYAENSLIFLSNEKLSDKVKFLKLKEEK